MKKIILALLTVSLLGSLFFACANSTGDSGNSNSGGGTGESGGSGSSPVVKNTIGVKFNFEGAQALAKLESKKSRSAADSDNLGDLVKILADGTMEDAVTVDENCSLSDIVAIYKSPLEDSKDVFIVFKGESTIGRDNNSNVIRVGQLICIHEDGSIADILKNEDNTDSKNTHMPLKTESVTFDASGNLYFVSRETGDMIYQYTPKKNELTKMVAEVENTQYDRIQIEDKGQWIFASGERGASYFLRAIPINNPNSPVNIYYSSSDKLYPSSWAYDAKNEKMYFLVFDNFDQRGLFIATKAGGFRDKKYYGHYVGTGYEDFFFTYGYYENASWTRYVKDSNDNLDAAKVIDKLLSALPEYNDSQTGETKTITSEDVDIRFDKLIEKGREFFRLNELTKGLKNEEAISALDNDVGRGLLYAITNRRVLSKYEKEGIFIYIETDDSDNYINNFLADILYVKDEDTLLKDTEKGEDLFPKSANGNYTDNYISVLRDIVGGPSDWKRCFSFSSQFYNSLDTLDASKVLDYFFNYCNIDGTKEFRLSALKNDDTYNALYSTLTNEDAINWLAADEDRMILFRTFLMGEYTGDSENINHTYKKYNKFMNALSKLCYIAGTDKKALSWNSDEKEIVYDDYFNSDRAGKISATETGVYYEWFDLSSPYYYIVQVADANGKMVELVNKLPLPSGKVVQSEKNKDRILLQYSMMDSNGAELGYHHIYAVEMATGKVTNCFDSVPNRNNLEVVSFNSAGDLLYYSAVRGTAVENGIVNIVTNEYNPLEVQRKMVAVYTFD